MTIIFDNEQQALREGVRKFAADTFASERTRQIMDTAEKFDELAWTVMAEQLGLQGLIVPEDLGGSGATIAEQAIVLEEMGYRIGCGPYFSTAALAATVLSRSGSEEARQQLGAIADGTKIATVAVVDTVGSPLGDQGLTATETRDGFTLEGTRDFVPDGHLATVILVVAGTDAGPRIFAVERDAPGLTRTPLTTLDLTRPQARLNFASTPAQPIAAPDTDGVARASALNLIRLLVAAEQLGGAQWCLDTSVDYAKLRAQFGRKIGSFQAIKHMCADMLVAVESARSAVYHGIETAALGSDEFSLAAPMALALTTEAYQFCARQTIQIHGGIGCTWEHDAHLHYRRAHAGSALIGSARTQKAVLAARLGM